MSVRLIGSHGIDVEPRASVVLQVQPVANASHMPGVFLIMMLFRLSSCSLWNHQTAAFNQRNYADRTLHAP